MTRALTEPKLVVATHNPGKLIEMRLLLEPFDVATVSAGELGLAEPEETGTTFIANASLKAHAAARAANLPALADDSGLCVDALGGAPGVYTADWAGPQRDFAMAMRVVEEKLQEAGARQPDQRRAHFVSVLVLAWPDGHEEIFEGVVEGRLVWPPRGPDGFGYDPMFLPDGFDRTFGEMNAEEKHGWSDPVGLSHRARAFKKLAPAVLRERAA